MFAQRSRCVELIVLLCFVTKIASKVEFTNVKCTAWDPEFADFEYCFLKSVNRTYKYLSLKVNLHKTPVTKVKVNIAIYKRFNGYKPFFYNITVDACRFLVSDKPNPIATYFHSMFKSYSNINHSCPFVNDLFVEKLPVSFIDTQVTEVLPVPHGDYLFHSNWLAYDINRATVNVYFTISSSKQKK